MAIPAYQLLPLYLLLLLLLPFTPLLLTSPAAVAADETGVTTADESLLNVSKDAGGKQQSFGDMKGTVQAAHRADDYRHTAWEFLKAHNRVRHYVGEAPYSWNHTLAEFARRWANTRRGDCQCIHSGGPYGENMFWGTGKHWRADDAVKSWALEHYDYDPQNNSCRPGRMCGHYTQIVWSATTMLGCARVDCYDGGVIITCNYDPPGNYLGESPFDSAA